MRLDIQRVRASAVRLGDVVAFYSPDRSQDHEVWSIYKRMDSQLVFNEGKHGQPVRPSDFVFIVSTK
jgi:hypothetical protein